MAIPDYQSLMLPLLKICGDGNEHNLSEVIAVLGQQLRLSEEELSTRIPSGVQKVFYGRVAWARTFLKAAGLLESTGVAKFRITNRGLEVLKENPSKLDNKYLAKFPEFLEFKKPTQKDDTSGNSEYQQSQTPLEQIADLHEIYNNSVVESVLDRLRALNDKQFEQVAIALLEKMGYGDKKHVGKPHDKGVDGMILQDTLGLDKILVQAKKWTNGVGRPEVQKFVGSMEQHKSSKGVLIATSHFPNTAQEYVTQVGKTVLLIDGKRLAELLVEHGLGVVERRAYRIQEIDNEYFQQL